jgi:hypothetical protein
MAKYLTMTGLLAAALALGGCNKGDYTAYALTTTGDIIEFNTGNPNDITNSVAVTISGSSFTSGSLLQIAYSPTSSGTLMGITSNSEVVTVDPTSGTATVVNSTSTFNTFTLNGTATTISISAPVLSIDPMAYSNLAAGELRVITSQYNLQVNPTTGETDADDTALTYQSGLTLNGAAITGTPQLVGLAYSNALPDAANTTLYGLDSVTSALVQVGGSGETSATSVNDGVVTIIGALGVSCNAGDSSFAIEPTSGTAYASLQNDSGATLYTVDLSTGAATEVGAIGDGTLTISSLALVPGSSTTTSTTTD